MNVVFVAAERFRRLPALSRNCKGLNVLPKLLRSHLILNPNREVSAGSAEMFRPQLTGRQLLVHPADSLTLLVAVLFQRARF